MRLHYRRTTQQRFPAPEHGLVYHIVHKRPVNYLDTVNPFFSVIAVTKQGHPYMMRGRFHEQSQAIIYVKQLKEMI